MKRLVFDTSSSSVLVGIWENQKWLGTIERAEAQTQSKELFAVLNEILNFHQIKKDEIQEIAVGIGPGSYTGLRIGLTVAKIWAFSAKIPLFKFSSEKLGPLEERTLAGLKAEDFEPISDINSIVPIYSQDHFS